MRSPSDRWKSHEVHATQKVLEPGSDVQFGESWIHFYQYHHGGSAQRKPASSQRNASSCSQEPCRFVLLGTTTRTDALKADVTSLRSSAPHRVFRPWRIPLPRCQQCRSTLRQLNPLLHFLDRTLVSRVYINMYPRKARAKALPESSSTAFSSDAMASSKRCALRSRLPATRDLRESERRDARD